MSSINSLSKSSINWPALMEQYEQSRLDRKQFCNENNISLPQFKYYRQKLKRQLSIHHKATLVPITLKAISEQEESAPHHFQLTFENGIRCQIPTDFNSNSLKQLIEVLQAC
jgi:hypothetical protein